jgi:hypothetical protein
MKHAYVVKMYRDDNVLCGEITLDQSIESPEDCYKTSMEREVIESIRRGEAAAGRTNPPMSPPIHNLTIGRLRQK